MKLQKANNIKDLGKADICLGIQIWGDRKAHTLTIDQRTYFDKVLAEFSMQNLKPVATLIDGYKYIKPALDSNLMAD